MWHPLLLHGEDTRACAQVLWKRMLARPDRERVALQLGISVEEAGHWLGGLAAAHDLGKAGAWFQTLAESQLPRLKRSGLQLHPNGPRVAHGRLTASVLGEQLGGLTDNPFDAADLAAMSGGHHGSFETPESAGDGASWGSLRRRLAEVWLDGLEPLPPLREGSGPALATIAGLITLADWVASNPQWFPLAVPAADAELAIGIGEHVEAARGRAERAWSELRWGQPAFRVGEPLAAVAPWIEKPTPMQAAVSTTLRDCKSQLLLVVEDRTGSGKTEAALAAVHSLISRGDARGAYVGLPTRATADQSFERVRLALSGASEEPVRVELLHGLAGISPSYSELAREQPRPQSVWLDEDREDGGVHPGQMVAGGWFSQRKRGLLAPCGVGTVDQAMLAAITVRHGCLRLAGLAGKVVVFDEVHAYDTYMLGIVERLVEWLAALRCSIVLLSATLPSDTRNQLAAGFARGSGSQGIRSRESGTSYPRLSVVADANATTERVQATSERTTRVELRASESLGEIGELVDAGLEVALIVNTVSRARRIHRAATDLGLEPALLHSRMRAVERSVLERGALDAYGPRGSRPGGSLLIATQVLEQSLDVDFDLVVSELCPIDLLFQRAGRSHRHPRSRPPEAGRSPWLWCFHGPVDPEDGMAQDLGPIYEHHIQLRTHAALLTRHAEEEPVKVHEGSSRSELDELVQAVYGNEDPGTVFGDFVRSGRWETTKAEMERNRAEALARARAVRLQPTDSEDWWPAGRSYDEDDQQIADALRPTTRMGPEAGGAIFLREDEASELPADVLQGLSAPSQEQAAWLRLRAAPIPFWDVKAASAATPHPVWVDRHPLLAGLPLACLDAGAYGMLGDLPVRLDPVLGVLTGTEVR